MCRPLILDEPCIGNTKKELINTVRFHWVSVGRENWNYPPQIETFSLDEHLFHQEENICATKDGMKKNKE